VVSLLQQLLFDYFFGSLIMEFFAHVCYAKLQKYRKTFMSPPHGAIFADQFY